MFLKKFALAGATAALLGSAAYAADCGPNGQSIRVLGSDFPAIQALSGTAQDNCAASASEFVISLKDNTRDFMNQALTPNPAEYSSVIVANATLTQLMNDGLVRPLNDLVEKYGANIKPNQLITIDGNVMAVAFMANSQHLFVREDILAEAGVEGIPATVDEVVAAAEKIRAAGIMEYPLVMNMQVGWNVGEVFNLFYLAHGGEFFAPGSAEPAINNDKARAALADIKRLAEYANPDYLTMASNETQAAWEAGQAALGIMWGSRGGAILDDEGATDAVRGGTVLAAAPTAGDGSTPAATLWWDGITIAANISDEEAEATFAALVSAMTSDMVAEHNDDAIWLLEGYKPGPAAAGVSATAAGGAKPYPMIPYINQMHNALGAELVDYFKGDESADQALADVEAAYMTAAKEAGFLK
ncbi:extracellular solute-binding protein [Aliishimia ponticola]|uniref:Extracellular solute-binding protein n=1 Tax=Aliishimia ponticola TaxID=2499833 RepID=A0A4S4NLB0_9RHOB|nr:extracellular solute-binding protein [Aliishimia ponticola]THH39101.1 extracellular solute-binding protein [Aliishimia ponticola]